MKSIIFMSFLLHHKVFKHLPLLQKPLSKQKNVEVMSMFSFMLTSLCHSNFFKKFGANLCPRILLVDKIQIGAPLRQKQFPDLVRRSCSRILFADPVRGKVLPRDHPRPAGVCAGIAMAGSFSCHLQPQKES